jgi:hypothetical protein
LKDFKEFKSLQLEEEKESLISKHPKTDQRRAELMKVQQFAIKFDSCQKYGSKLSGAGPNAGDV